MRQSLRNYSTILVMVLLSLVPLFANAQMSEQVANAMCKVVIPACPCGTIPTKAGCTPGTNQNLCIGPPKGCWDSITTPPYTHIGKCIAVNDCKYLYTIDASGQQLVQPSTALGRLGDSVGGFMSSNPLVTSLAVGAGMTLLTSFMNSAGSGAGDTGAGAGYGDPGGSFCASGRYYYSANPPPGDPCAVYSPTGGGSTPTTGASSTNISDLLNGINNGSSTGGLLNGCSTAASITCPVGYKQQTQPGGSNGCAYSTVCVPDTASSTGQQCGSGFCSAGTYCSAVQVGQCVPNGNVDCGSYSCQAGFVCGNSGSNQCIDPDATPISDTISDPNNYQDNTNANTPDPSQTDLNKKQIPVPADGVHGDLLSFGGGATIYGQSRSGGTEVSGFFGGSGTGALCARRPWATNFLSYVIPPSFFDGLCSAAGFGASGGRGGTSDLVGVRSVTGPAGPSYTAPAAQTGVFPEAHIQASPPSVNLGGRTTIFWTSHDVSSCVESSSDGNFTGSSTSGGASTVALAGPVTFYINCLGIDGNYVSDQVTVNIGI